MNDAVVGSEHARKRVRVELGHCCPVIARVTSGIDAAATVMPVDRC